jgi:hypothetical protein
MPRRYCRWSEIEPGSGVYNTCKEGEIIAKMRKYVAYGRVFPEPTPIDGEGNASG